MPENKKPTRKISAILSADGKGYSILLAVDEVYTNDTLKAYRKIISEDVNRRTPQQATGNALAVAVQSQPDQ